MKYLIAACAIFALSLLILSYAHASEVGDGFNDIGFRPVIEYRTVDTSYTGWNKATLTSMVLFFGFGDTISTGIGLNNGLSEGNPIYGEHPSMGVIIPAKIVVMVGAWAITEYAISPKDRQIARNWIFGSFAGAGLVATVLNARLILK